jgi:hypothetical protein
MQVILCRLYSTHLVSLDGDQTAFVSLFGNLLVHLIPRRPGIVERVHGGTLSRALNRTLNSAGTLSRALNRTLNSAGACSRRRNRGPNYAGACSRRMNGDHTGACRRLNRSPNGEGRTTHRFFLRLDLGGLLGLLRGQQVRVRVLGANIAIADVDDFLGVVNRLLVLAILREDKIAHSHKLGNDIVTVVAATPVCSFDLVSDDVDVGACSNNSIS